MYDVLKENIEQDSTKKTCQQAMDCFTSYKLRYTCRLIYSVWQMGSQGSHGKLEFLPGGAVALVCMEIIRCGHTGDHQYYKSPKQILKTGSISQKVSIQVIPSNQTLDFFL